MMSIPVAICSIVVLTTIYACTLKWGPADTLDMAQAAQIAIPAELVGK